MPRKPHILGSSAFRPEERLTAKKAMNSERMKELALPERDRMRKVQ